MMAATAGMESNFMPRFSCADYHHHYYEVSLKGFKMRVYKLSLRVAKAIPQLDFILDPP